MRIELPLLTQKIVEDQLVSQERIVSFDLDTSVYSEERWEQNFPALAEKEGLFQYIERVHQNSLTEKVRVIAMLKAIFCFIESSDVPTYKEFAKMFNLATPEYTERLINSLLKAFRLVLGSSSVKN